MAEGADVDKAIIEIFGIFVVKEQAKTLSAEEKRYGKTTTVRRILKEVLEEKGEIISKCEASVLPKYQDQKTKKISAEDFVNKFLPDYADVRYGKGKGEAKLPDLKRMLGDKLPSLKMGPKTKNAAVVDRLTDTSKYTGSHQQRFDPSGKGKGKAGREDVVEKKGYVQGYKGEDTYDKK